MRKSERLKKLESELSDLKQWLELGLVPKRELKKHKEEIKVLEKRISEENSRLKLLKETGDQEEFMIRKKQKPFSAEPQTLPDVEVKAEAETPKAEEAEEAAEIEPATKEAGYKEEATVIEELEEDPFSDKNRWKRGILEDPDADLW
jgi:LPS O-antigen subunit length determinant protein (WzzB/FepE family)